MAAPKKCSVTYTKHVKQKRKVYQDGFLSFDSSSNKVMLYDSSEKLLECRLLKSDEVVRCGETLMFNAYLVDVGDLEGEDGPLDGVSSCSGAMDIDEEHGKSKAEKSRAWTTTLCPSQNVIRDRHFRELKRREISKYGMLSNSPESIPSTADWHVLYTAQLTQKAKKYHDGYLHCTNAGSLNSQFQLYDENWKLLDCRFMKKAEEVKPGEKIIFHAHVVEVVKPRGNHETSRSSYTARNSDQSFHQLHDKKVPNDLKSHKPVGREWQVLYTVQVTKKAKTYQDGFLQLTMRGYLGGQITLYDESRRVLNNRFLKKGEQIQSGKTIAFDGHLVDIGVPEGQVGIPADLNDEVGSISDQTKMHVNFSKAVIRQSIEKGQLAGKNVQRPSSVGDCSSNAGISIVKETEQTARSSMPKPLRDARQILAILRDPCPEEKGIAPSSDASEGMSAFIVREPHSPENAIPDSLDDGTKPAFNGATSIEIVDFQASETALGCTESQLGQALQVQDLDKPCYDNESNAQGGRSALGASTSSHPLSHSGEMRTFGPIKTDPEMHTEFPSFDLGF